MFSPLRLAYAPALVLVASCSGLTSAFAHAVCGDRVFPATLGINDPGVGDEFSVPTIAYLPANSSGQREFDVGAFSWSKTIYPNIGVTISDGATWLHPGGSGWDPLSTEFQWGNFCSDDHEFMASLGFTVNWSGTGTGSQTQPFNIYQPVIDIGKGFGDLPRNLQFLQPLATTFELSETFPGQAWTNGNQNSTTLNGGFTVQYSLPYFNSQVAAIDNDVFKHLIPIAEFTFSRPVAHFAPGTNQMTGTIQPGVIYLGATYQVGLEAIVPLSKASGHGMGGIFSIDLYLDDLFPDSIGRPLFGVGK